MTIKPNVDTGQLPISPRVQMVDVVNQTRVLKQACFCPWKYPRKSVGKLCEVLEQERYHIRVLDKWTDFQAYWWNPHHFIGIFVQVPFHAFRTRQSCSSLLLGVNKFLNFINRHSKKYLAGNFWKAPLQNLLTRVCKSQFDNWEPCEEGHRSQLVHWTSELQNWYTFVDITYLWNPIVNFDAFEANPRCHWSCFWGENCESWPF